MYKSIEAIKAVTESSGLEHTVLAHQDAGVHGPAPLVVLAHGRSGNRTSMKIFASAFDSLKPIVVLPEGFIEDPLGNYSWWPVTGPPDPSGKRLRKATLEELTSAFDRFGVFVDEAVRHYQADPDRLFAAGFSQGAALVGSLSLTRPELFAGVALLAGLVPRVVKDENELIAPQLLDGSVSPARYFMQNGTRDRIVPVERGKETRDKLESLGAEVTFFEEEVTHKVGSAGREALAKWAESFAPVSA